MTRAERSQGRITHRKANSCLSSLPCAATRVNRNGCFFAAEDERLQALETTFAQSAVNAAQFAFTLDIEGMDEPIPAYAVITREEEGFGFIMTRDGSTSKRSRNNTGNRREQPGMGCISLY